MSDRSRFFYPWACVVAFCVGLTASAMAQSADPLAGRWKLNLARTHYGQGVDRRKEETFVWKSGKHGVTCTINSVRSDGRRLVGTFSAAYDGKDYATTGVKDIDNVRLQLVNESIVDATFSYKGKPVFAYRAVRSDNGRSLTIISVDPVTRAALTSVVVYERQ